MSGIQIAELEKLAVMAEKTFKDVASFFNDMGAALPEVKGRFKDLLDNIDYIENAIEIHADSNHDTVLEIKNFDVGTLKLVSNISGFSVEGLDDSITHVIKNAVEDILTMTTRIPKVKDTVDLMIMLHDIRKIVFSRVLGILPSKLNQQDDAGARPALHHRLENRYSFKMVQSGDAEPSFDAMIAYTTILRQNGEDGMASIRMSRIVHDLMVAFHRNFKWKDTRLSEVIKPNNHPLKINLVRALKDTDAVDMNEFDGSAGIGEYSCGVYLGEIKRKYL